MAHGIPISVMTHAAQVVRIGVIPALWWHAELAAAEIAPFTATRQVLELSPAEARKSQAVRLSGTVIHAGWDRFWLQDETGSLLVAAQEAGTAFGFSPGQTATVEGVTTHGMFAPYVFSRESRVTGTAPLPVPVRAAPARMAAGEHYGRLVEVDGVVRDVSANPLQVIALVASEGVDFRVFLPLAPLPELPPDWLDARVRVTGLNWTEADTAGRPGGFTVRLNRREDMRFLTPGNPDVFLRPARAIAAVRQQGDLPDMRVRVTGTVIAQLRGGAIFLHDSTGALQALPLAPLIGKEATGRHLDQPPAVSLSPGDLIELTGAPQFSAGSPRLDGAVYRVTGQAAAAAPVRTGVNELLAGRHICELVTLSAHLVRRESLPAGRLLRDTLLLRDGETFLEAALETEHPDALAALTTDSTVEVTGVVTARADSLKNEPWLTLWLRSPGDARVTGPAPVEMSRAAKQALWVAGVVLAAAVGWIALLRWRVARRTADLRLANARLADNAQELEGSLARERELSELKTRFVQVVSHEFRTPLGIILSSSEILDAYFDRLDSAGRREHLEAIQSASGRMAGVMEDVLVLGGVEAGRMHCRRSPLDLTEFCRGLIEEVLTSTARRCPIHFGVGGGDQPARADSGLLRHIFLNLLSNAVKYSADGAPVRFSVTGDNGNAVFRIADEGLGIPEADHARLFTLFHRGANVIGISGTGLGLVVVKRCVDLHGGAITFDSVEGRGSTFTVTLPLFAAIDS
jgi:signal transduction histidine kinase